MKIKSIDIADFLCIESFHLDVAKPITVICGPNESGKTSIQHGIRMALLGQSCRVALKKHYAEYVRDGADKAVVSVTTDGGGADDETMTVTLTASGRVTGMPTEKNADLRLVSAWDVERLSSLDDTERKRTLLELSGADLSWSAIEEMLKREGVGMDTIMALRPYLKAGFAPARDEARSNAALERAAWKQITGQTYGSEKAEVWTPAIPAFPQDSRPAAEMEAEYDALTAKRATLQARLKDHEAAQARAEQARQRRQEAEAVLAATSEAAETIEATAAEIPRLEAEKLRQEQIRDESAAREPGCRPQTTDCPRCGAALVVRGQRLEVPPEADAGDPGDPEAHAAAEKALETIEHALSAARSTQAEAQKAQRDRDRAEATLAALGGSEGEEPAALDRDEAATEIEALDEQRAALRQAIQDRSAVEAERARIEDRMIEATKAHQAVQAWVQAEKLLSPDGIPAKLMKQAVGPLNAALAASATLAGWHPAAITQDSDLEIRYRDHSMNLISESARWRVNVMLAHVCAAAHNVGTLLLDRIDVLDVPSRSALLKWCTAIAAETGIQFILFGTLKSAPADDDNIHGVWLGE